MVVLCKEGNASKYAKEARDAGRCAIDCMKDTLLFKRNDAIAATLSADAKKVFPQKLFDKILDLNAEHVELFVELDNEIGFSLWMFLNRNGICYTFLPDDFSREEIGKITGQWLAEDFDGDITMEDINHDNRL